jgi:hypothetical protein
MPCSITAAGDQYDNDNTTPRPFLLDDRMDEIRDIEEIAEGLLNGDKFKTYGHYTVDFSNVIDDELACNPEFANALRKLINAGENIPEVFEAAQQLVAIANNATHELAESIYESKE